MADSCGTLVKAKDVLYDAGAVDVKCIATHGILSQGSYNAIKSGNLKLMVSDSCEVMTSDINGVILPETVDVIPLRNFLMDICHRIENDIMMGTLFTGWCE